MEFLQSFYAWLIAIGAIGSITALALFLGDYFPLLLVPMLIASIWLVWRNLRERPAYKVPTRSEQGIATTAAPEDPAPTEVQHDARTARQTGATRMQIEKFVNTEPGPKAHPALFTIFFLALIPIYVGLYRALFNGWVPISSTTLPNGLGSLAPEDFVPALALVVFLVQRAMRDWRPGGVNYGILDFLISAVPVIIIAAAFASWINLFDAFIPPATKSHYAMITAMYFAIGAALDILFNTWKRTGYRVESDRVVAQRVTRDVPVRDVPESTTDVSAIPATASVVEIHLHDSALVLADSGGKVTLTGQRPGGNLRVVG